MSNLKFSAAVAERPLVTGKRAYRRASRFLNRQALRRDVNLAELLGIPVEQQRSIRPGRRKPYHATTCPGEWRDWTLLAFWQGEETLFVNQRARTVMEAKHRLQKDHPGIEILEVRQQMYRFTLEGEAELWWDGH